MKPSRKNTRCKAHALPQLRFEDQQLTSFSGMVLLQALFSKLKLSERLELCFRGSSKGHIYGPAKVVMILVVHLYLGYRSLNDKRYYEDDPMILRVLGLKNLPDISILSRTLSSLTEESVRRLGELIQRYVLERLASLQLRRVTLDFDGSVLGTSRWAEGTAIGFNPKKKGQRSYYPLFCTVAQLGQVLGVLHRSGNVHDSRDSENFIRSCVEQVRAALPHACIEIRMDSAFFGQKTLRLLHELKVEFTISVPFRGISCLKERIERRRVWHRINDKRSYFSFMWNSKKHPWPRQFNIVVIRTSVPKVRKEPVQLDLFDPQEEGFDFRALITNKFSSEARTVVAFHHGRGSQEKIFAELKTQAQMDYVPTRTWVGNKTFLLCAILAHNLNRELQMATRPRDRTTTEKRKQIWIFETLETVRRKFIQRAGRLIRPQGRLTLSMNPNSAVQQEVETVLAALQAS